MTASTDEIKALLTSIQQKLDFLEGQWRRGGQTVIVSGLSDISENLGLLNAGEFRAGNGVQPGRGFSGIRIAYPAVSYASALWNIAGISNDVLQFGLRSSDGAALFGGGLALLDTNGLTLQDAGGKPVLTAVLAAHTVNGESLAVGDVLIGDNSSGKPNLVWKQASGKFYSRSGTVVAGEVTGGTFKQYGAEVRDASGQTIADDTVSVITFDTETRDDAGFYDSGSPTKLTIPTGLGGIYRVGIWTQWAGDVDGMRKMGIAINKSAPYSTPSFALKPVDVRAAVTVGTPLVIASCEAPVSLSAGDYIEMLVHHTAGGNLGVVAHMWIQKEE